MNYKPVGINEDSIFPPRVMEALDERYNTADYPLDDNVAGLLGDADSDSREVLDTLYQTKGTVDDQPVANRIRGGALHAPANNPTQIELMRQMSHRGMNNLRVQHRTRLDSTNTRYYYTVARLESYGQRLPGAIRHEYAGNYQTSWTPGTPGIPPVEDITALANRKVATLVAVGAGVSQSGPDIGQIAGASWRDGVKYQGMSNTHQKHMECIGFDDNGVARVYSLLDGDTDGNMIADNVQDAWGFGPYLIKNGVQRTLASVPTWAVSDVWMNTRSARMILGQSQNGSIILIAVEGISGSRGIYGQDIVALAAAEGCYNAVALDGGGSVQMLVNGDRVHPSSDVGRSRPHGDFIVLNAQVVTTDDTGWRDIPTPNFTGLLQYRVTDGKMLHVQGNLTGDFPADSVFNVTDTPIPREYWPLTSAVRGAAYFGGGYPGLAHVLTSGLVGVANRTGGSRTNVLFAFNGLID